MPHTPTTLFADMLGLLKELEWSATMCEVRLTYSACPECLARKIHGHAEDCHLKATIALAEANTPKE